MLDVCLAGTSGMVPLKDRWLTTLYASSDGHAVLIDSGEGTQVALAAAGCHVKRIDAICITHYHLDHIGGIAGLLLAMGNAGRTEPVDIIGPPGLVEVLKGLLIIAVPPFDVTCYQVVGSDEVICRAGKIEIRAFSADHVVPCLGYTLTLPRKPKFDPEKARENDIPIEAWSLLQKGDSVKIGDRIVDPSLVLGEERKGLKLLYSTDTRPTDTIVEMGKGADLMILEGEYGTTDKIDRAIKWGHMTFPEAAELAKRSGAKELWLTHFSQSMPDPEEYLENAAAIFPNTVIGYDGIRKTLAFED